MSDQQKPSTYRQYLPVILQGEGTSAQFLNQFLKAFEKMLADRPEDLWPEMTGSEAGPVGIETILDQIQNYFDPYLAPPQFLQWLASWVALNLKEDKEWYGDEDFAERNQKGDQLAPLEVKRQTRNRYLIDQIVQLYQKRGTREGLIAYIKVNLGEQTNITINEFEKPFCLGVDSTIGWSTVVGEARPYYFEVDIFLPITNRQLLEEKRQILTEIIDREKPAHTYYGLIVTVPTMKIGYHSRVGSDTLLGGSITS